MTNSVTQSTFTSPSGHVEAKDHIFRHGPAGCFDQVDREPCGHANRADGRLQGLGDLTSNATECSARPNMGASLLDPPGRRLADLCRLRCGECRQALAAEPSDSFMSEERLKQ